MNTIEPQANPVLRRLDDVAPQAWKNGGGRTRELCVWSAAGDGGNRGDWQVRLSVADIAEAGPFSAYPGVQRWFAVLDGAGVELLFGPQHRVRHRFGDEPIVFDGARPPFARLLDGPTRDLNLMLRNAEGMLARVVPDAGDWAPMSRVAGLFSAVSGRCRADGRTIDVPAHALLWFDPSPQRLAFEASAPAPAPDTVGWWIAATPRETAR